MSKRFYNEIHILRGLGGILVLMGHSFPDAELNWFPNVWMRWAHDFFYAFHMALFFIVSGFVMGRKFFEREGGTYNEVVKKFKRLMVPYLFLSYLSLLPKIVWNAYAKNPVDGASAWRILLGRSPNGSLWYLYTLFFISVILLLVGRMFVKSEDNRKTYILCVLAVISLVLDLFIGPERLSKLYLDKVGRYLLYYILGMFFWYRYDHIKKIIKPGIGIGAFLMVALFSCPYIGFECPYLLTALLGVYGVWGIALYLVSRKGFIYVFLNKCGTYSYDIYILSYYVQQFIRVVFYHKLEVSYTIVFFAELIVSFIMSIVFAKWVLRKNRLFKILLIGEW